MHTGHQRAATNVPRPLDCCFTLEHGRNRRLRSSGWVGNTLLSAAAELSCMPGSCRLRLGAAMQPGNVGQPQPVAILVAGTRLSAKASSCRWLGPSRHVLYVHFQPLAWCAPPPGTRRSVSVPRSDKTRGWTFLRLRRRTPTAHYFAPHDSGQGGPPSVRTCVSARSLLPQSRSARLQRQHSMTQ